MTYLQNDVMALKGVIGLLRVELTGGFPSQRTSNVGFDGLPDVSLNKRLNKQSSVWTNGQVAGDLRHHAAHVTSL